LTERKKYFYFYWVYVICRNRAYVSIHTQCDNCVCDYAGACTPECGSDCVSAIIRGYKTIPRIRAEPLFNLFTSGMQLRMFCRVLRAMRLYLWFVVKFCMKIHNIIGWDDIEMLISRTYSIRFFVCNQEFMIKPEICDCFLRIYVLCTLKFNIAKIRELISQQTNHWLLSARWSL